MPSLAVLVLYSLSHFEEVLTAWHDAGALELTVIDGVGTRLPSEQAGRDDLPLLPSIRDLLQADDAPRRIIFTIIPDELVEPIATVTERVLGDLRERGNGVLVVLPASYVLGFRY